MTVIVANDTPPAIRGMLKRWFVEPKPNVFVGTVNRRTRDKILDEVWGDDLIVTQRSVDRCINTLRGKIEADPERPVFVRTIRDVGYRFETG